MRKLSVTLMLAIAVIANEGYAAACLGDSLALRQWPEELGRQMARSIMSISLPCDTMVVPLGKTVEVRAGTLLHFGESVNTDCVIHVQGQLIANGTASLPIFFAGNAHESPLGMVHGKGKWGGILVDTLGSVNFKQVRIMHAATPFTFSGEQSVLDSITFVGSYGLILRGGKNYALDPKGFFIASWDLQNPQPFQAKSRSSMKKGRARRAWIWGSAAGVLLAGGAATYAIWPEDKKISPPGQNEENFRPEPLPGGPGEKER